MNLLLPKTFVKLKDVSTRNGTKIQPVVFLAGPIRGADDWQKEAIIKLSVALPDALIVCPSRYGPDHELYKHALVQTSATTKFESQTEWERHYMSLASRTGAIMFWIPKESLTNPRPREEGPYAQDTYGELGEWRGRLIGFRDTVTRFPEVGEWMSEPSLIIGAQPDGLSGLAVIKKNYKYSLGIKFHDTLEATLKATVATIR